MSYLTTRRRRSIIIKAFGVTFVVIVILHWIDFVPYRLSLYDVQEETRYYINISTSQPFKPLIKHIEDKYQLLAVGGQLTPGKFSRSMVAVYESLITQGESKVVYGLGDDGVAVTLTGADEEAGKLAFKERAFNIIASDKVALNRTLRDARHFKCMSQQYDAILPLASVVIIFCNEAWSALLRTIYSVLNRTPQSLLKEIVLVDDFSDHDELRGKLEYYISTRLSPKVRLYRLHKRQGLIRARLAGAELATGDVLVFLDAHCEVGNTWLEPMLERIKKDRTVVAIPIIDVIDDKTLEYQFSDDAAATYQVGGFSWNGHFTWIDVPKYELLRIKHSPIAPVRSPTMAGGLFAMDRSYFWEVGSYDRDMDLWGGENLEMSFRVWQCGGALQTIPCSRVGHIFRSFHPYKFPDDKDSHGINTVRLVEVWMDDYKRLFYLNRPDLTHIEYGDINERVELRKRLKCKSFKWYLDHIYKEKFVPDENVIGYGRIYTKVNRMCLDNLQKDDELESPLGVYRCHGIISGTQLFSFSQNGELRREALCAEPTNHNNEVVLSKCSDTSMQEWELSTLGQIINVETQLCLDSAHLSSGDIVRVATCRSSSMTQRWHVDNLANKRSNERAL